MRLQMLGFFKRKKLDPKRRLAESLGELELPSFSTMTVSALRLLRDPKSSTAAIAEAIESNPGVVVRLLRMVNSAAYGLAQRVDRVGHAVNLLGRGDNGSVKFQNAYTSSKIWVRNFTETLAKEYDESGIDIFGFNPGIVFTDMINQVEAVAGYEEKMQPLRIVAPLLGNDADVPAAKALWLASAESDGKNGMMSTVLTRGFMLKRLLLGAWKWVSHRFKKLDLHIERVEPPRELAPVPIKNRDSQR